MHLSLAPLAAILRTNSALLRNCLDGVDDRKAQERVAGVGNNIAFLVAHLVQCRHWMATALGAPLTDPMGEYLDAARTIDDIGVFPTVSELLDAWDRISAHLATALERVDTPRLEAPGRKVPGADGTILGELAYLVEHDSYHLGQVALLRRQVGLPATSLGVPHVESTPHRPDA